MILFLTN